MEELFKKLGKSKEEIVSLIKIQYAEWEEFMRPKAEEMNTYVEYYLNLQKEKSEWKELDLWDETVYTTVNAMMARSISDEVRAEFEAGNEQDKIITDNLNATLKQDYDSDDMLAIDLVVNFFRFVCWVGIKIRKGWNGRTKENEFNYIDPRIWIPDQNGNYMTGDFAYSGFSTYLSEFALDPDWNTKNLKPFGYSDKSSAMQKYRDQQLEGYQPNNGTEENKYFDIYYHYLKIRDKKGKEQKCLAILGNWQSELVHFEIYEDISEDIPAEFPFSFEYYGFEPNSVTGDSVVRHLIQPSKLKALLREVRARRAKMSVMPMWFYNQKYLNKQKLQWAYDKFVPINTESDWPVNMDQIIKPIFPDNQETSTTLDMELDREIEKMTSIWPNVQGASQKARDTATEAQIVQGNTDINLLYRDKISNLGKKQFIKVWLQGYLINFAEWDKKLVMMYHWNGATPVELKKKDFLIGSYHRIKVKSASQVESQRRKDSQALSQITSLVASVDFIDNFQKVLMLRDFALALGYDENKVMTRLSGWPEEELVKAENEILFRGAYLDINPTDNHLMHIMLQKPNQNSNTETIAHFHAHIVNWIEAGKQIANSGWNWILQWMQASMQASNTAQLQKSNNNPQPLWQ